MLSDGLMFYAMECEGEFSDRTKLLDEIIEMRRAGWSIFEACLERGIDPDSITDADSLYIFSRS